MMSSRLAQRVLTRSIRPAARVSARTSGHASRRFASTGAGHAAKASSDTPWMIGSALVFGPVIAYLLTGSSKQKATHASEHSHAKTHISHIPEPSTPQEPEPKAEEAPSPAEVESSTAQAVASDSPKDAQAAEEAGSEPASEDGKVHGAPAMTDSEGTTASAEEIDASMSAAFKSNLPTDAQAAEESASAPAEEKPSEQKSDSPEPTSSEGETKDAGAASEETPKEAEK